MITLPVSGGAFRRLLKVVYRLPEPVRHRLAGVPRVVEGMTFDLDFQLLARLAQIFAPTSETASLLERRAAMNRGGLILTIPGGQRVRTRDVDVPGETGTILTRLYQPPGTLRGLLVFVHGGGFLVGSIESADPISRWFALHSDCLVLSVDYRLAPEHPYPAGLRDVVTALSWASENRAALGLSETAPIAVGGDSAGGNLAIEAALTVAQSHRPEFVLALYPVVAFGRMTTSRTLFGDGYGLDLKAIAEYEHHYLHDKPDAGDGPALLERTDLRMLPSTYIALAGFDPLRDEGSELAEKLRSVDVPVELKMSPTFPHAYSGLAGFTPSARSAMLDAARALKAALSRTTTNSAPSPEPRLEPIRVGRGMGC
jgi:acetyl esterase